MESLSELLIGNKNLENVKRVATEMENAKRDFEIRYTNSCVTEGNRPRLRKRS